MLRVGGSLASFHPFAPLVPGQPHHTAKVAHWLATPGRDAGPVLYDLVAQQPAVLTNFTASSGWRNTRRPGGWAQLTFDGTNDYLIGSNPAAAVLFTTPFSAAVWFRTTALGRALVSRWARNSSPGWFFGQSPSAGTLDFSLLTANGGAGRTVRTTAAWNDGAWHRALATHDGSGTSAGLRLYVDGIPAATTNPLNTNPGTAVAAPIHLGQTGGILASSYYYLGDLDDAIVWARTLTAADAASDYSLSRLGYPGELTPRLTVVVLSAGAAGQTIAPGSIESGERFGAAAVNPGAVLLAPGSIESGEASGAVILSPGPVVLSPGGVASGEAWGAGSIGAGASSVSPGGVKSGEAFGAAVLAPGVVILAPGGVETGERFGAVSIAAGASSVSPGGVESGEVFGAASVAPGSSSVAPGSGESSEAFGAASLMFGAPAPAQTITPGGVESGEASGALSIVGGPSSFAPGGAESGERSGALLVGAGPVILTPGGVGTGERFGSIVVTAGGQTPGVSLTEVMQAVGAVLLAEGIGNAVSIVETIEEDPDKILPTMGSPHFLIAPEKQVVDQAQVRGAGRHLTGMDGSIRIQVRMRQRRDQAYRDSHALYDEAGILAVVDRLVDVLHMCFPDAHGRPGYPALMYPMRLDIQEKPRRSKDLQAPEWMVNDLTFLVKWRRKLDLTRP